MAVKFKDTININGQYTLPLTDGTDGQVLVTDGAGNLTFSSELIAGSAESAESTHLNVKNTSGASIAKGTPVYVTGSVGNTDKLEIAPADASNASHMPAIGLLESTLANNGEGFVVQGGLLKGLVTDTIDGSSSTANDTVYVKAGGGLTLTKPTGSTNFIQNIAKVARVHSSNGSLIVSSILRTNDVPNLTTGKIWVGDGNTIESTVVHVDETNGKVGIGTDSPNQKIHAQSTGSSTIITERTGVNAGIIGLYGSNNPALVYDGSLRIASITDTALSDFTERMRIDSSGNVGISSGYLLVGTDSGDSFNSNAIFRGQGADAYIQLKSNTTNSAGILFGDTDDDFVGGMIYNNNANYLYFNSNNAERMRIDSSGRVGIGTTSPLDLLHIKSTTTDARLFLDGSVDSELKFAQSGTVKYSIGHDAGTGNFVIGTTNVDTGQRLVIDSSGNVGIGTTAPNAPLEILFNETNPNNDFSFAQKIDANFSGADNTTSDREQGGLWLDIDSSADGDLSDEHRLYGI